MYRSELAEDEVDIVMARVPPGARNWCSVGCGPTPGEDLALRPLMAGCACSGCLYAFGARLTWEEWHAWLKRGVDTPFVEWRDGTPAPRTLEERLEDLKWYKARALSLRT